MKANYHTHTYRCNHAEGTDEDYVYSALKSGIEILGFSDHTPYIFPGDYYSFFRMRPELLPGYCQSVNALKEDYKSKVQVHLGVEAEYYPAYFPRLLELLRDNGVEYMILGQHHILNEIGTAHSMSPAPEEEKLAAYCRQTMDAMNTGLFTYFAHPDVFNFTGDRRIYQKYMQQLVKEAKSCGVVLEMNVLGLRDGRHYPSREFWELAAQEGCKTIVGIDAHSPWHLEDMTSVKKATAWLQELGIPPMETIDLVPID